ncbi:MAG: GntR family transcriptional regulator [Burkholderiales bacterium]|nr:GntR family transcriptional regulator [Burkholderiales bacterium]
MLRPLSPAPDLVDTVHDALLEAILAGELSAGHRYTQEALAERLGVSRQPVMQALRMLRQQGLIIDTDNRRGVQVPPLDARFIEQLYELRAALDAAAARAAARTPRPELRAEGLALLDEGRKAVAAGELRRMVAADLAFHLFIYEASGNTLLLQTARQHWHHTQRAMSAYLRQPGALRTVWSEHQRILDAIVKGDADAAERCSREHAEQSGHLLATASSRGAAPPATH